MMQAWAFNKYSFIRLGMQGDDRKADEVLTDYTW